MHEEFSPYNFLIYLCFVKGGGALPVLQSNCYQWTVEDAARVNLIDAEGEQMLPLNFVVTEGTETLVYALRSVAV